MFERFYRAPHRNGADARCRSRPGHRPLDRRRPWARSTSMPPAPAAAAWWFSSRPSPTGPPTESVAMNLGSETPVVDPTPLALPGGGPAANRHEAGRVSACSAGCGGRVFCSRSAAVGRVGYGTTLLVLAVLVLLVASGSVRTRWAWVQLVPIAAIAPWLTMRANVTIRILDIAACAGLVLLSVTSGPIARRASAAPDRACRRPTHGVRSLVERGAIFTRSGRQGTGSAGRRPGQGRRARSRVRVRRWPLWSPSCSRRQTTALRRYSRQCRRTPSHHTSGWLWSEPSCSPVWHELRRRRGCP